MRRKRSKWANRNPFMYWPPWRLTEWWKPALYRGTDEWWCRSLAMGLPFLGQLIVFYRGHNEHVMCARCGIVPPTSYEAVPGEPPPAVSRLDWCWECNR